MSLRMLRLFTGFILAAIFFLFACQLPGQITQSIRGSGSLITSTPSTPISPTKSTSQAGLASATPVMAFTATPEPAIPTVAPAYPAGETQGTPIPSQTIGSSAPLTTLVVPSTPDLDATSSNTGTPTGGTQASVPGAYPGLEVGQATLPADNSYPGPAQVTASGSEGSYPEPGSQATSAVPATSSVLGQATNTPVASPTASVTRTQPSSSSHLHAETWSRSTAAICHSTDECLSHYDTVITDSGGNFYPCLRNIGYSIRNPNSRSYDPIFPHCHIFCAHPDPHANSDAFLDPYTHHHLYAQPNAHTDAGAALGECPVACHRSAYGAVGGWKTAIDRILCLLERS